jgi:exodeoxyribonuclease VII small subunit
MATKKTASSDQSSDKPSQAMPDFERAMAELEAVVERLEQGELPLDQALSHFERGVQLTGACQAALKAAEQKVEILLKKSGASEVSAFESQDVDPGADDASDVGS